MQCLVLNSPTPPPPRSYLPSRGWGTCSLPLSDVTKGGGGGGSTTGQRGTPPPPGRGPQRPEMMWPRLHTTPTPGRASPAHPPAGRSEAGGAEPLHSHLRLGAARGCPRAPALPRAAPPGSEGGILGRWGGTGKQRRGGGRRGMPGAAVPLGLPRTAPRGMGDYKSREASRGATSGKVARRMRKRPRDFPLGGGGCCPDPLTGQQKGRGLRGRGLQRAQSRSVLAAVRASRANLWPRCPPPLPPNVSLTLPPFALTGAVLSPPASASCISTS